MLEREREQDRAHRGAGHAREIHESHATVRPLQPRRSSWRRGLTRGSAQSHHEDQTCSQNTSTSAFASSELSGMRQALSRPQRAAPSATSQGPYLTLLAAGFAMPEGCIVRASSASTIAGTTSSARARFCHPDAQRARRDLSSAIHGLFIVRIGPSATARSLGELRPPRDDKSGGRSDKTMR